MPKLVVIGRRADILPFKALGGECIEVDGAPAAETAIERVRKAGGPVLVMLTEDLMNACRDVIGVFRETQGNMLLPIPPMTGASGARLQEIRAAVARALGVDLLGQKQAGFGEKG